MNGKSSYALVGAFVIALTTAFIWGALWISSGGRSNNVENYLIYMEESVSGLNIDSPIKYRGVDVGSVEQISIDNKNPNRIRLVVGIQEGTPLNASTVATLEYQGLTGIANINLKTQQNADLPLVNQSTEVYPVIPSKPSLLSRLDDDLPDMISDLTTTIENVNDLLSANNREGIQKVVSNLASFTTTLAQHSAQVESVFDHTDTLLENTSAASVGLPELVQQYASGAEKLNRLLGDIEKIGTSLVSTSTDIEGTISASGNDLKHFTSATLPELADAVTELKQVSANLRRMSELLANNPSALIYRRDTTRRGPGE